MVSDMLVTEIRNEIADNDDSDEDLAKKYQSCPIRMDSLRNSLRASIASKRGSMTVSELIFVEAMLEEPLEENQLVNMDEVLRCDNTFFQDPVPRRHTLPDDLLIDESENSESEFQRKFSLDSSKSQLGSKERQKFLKARRELSAQQSTRRSKTLWRKASTAAHLMTLLSKAKKNQDEKTGADEDETGEKVDKIEKEKAIRKPVFLKQASMGEGFEIGFDEETFNKKDSEDEEGKEEQTRPSPVTSTPTGRGNAFRRASSNFYDGKGFEVADSAQFEEIYEGENRKAYEQYDPWLFQEIDRNGKPREFTILGTSHDDSACHPHVLYPIQMDRLQPFLPPTKQGESFWLKYSLVRDGASTISFLKQVRASPYTLVAIETIDGEVFGGFFSNAWKVQNGYFGTGESFLWRMKTVRKVIGVEKDEDDDSSSLSQGSLAEQIERESDIEVFPSEVYYANNYFQLCQHDKIAAGGGTVTAPQDFGSDLGGTYAPHEIGFGFHLGTDGSLLQGSSAASLTYRNPPLAITHKDGSAFEVLNLEVWGFTPCQTEDEARVLEYKNMFFRKHSSGSIH